MFTNDERGELQDCKCMLRLALAKIDEALAPIVPDKGIANTLRDAQHLSRAVSDDVRKIQTAFLERKSKRGSNNGNN